jgi:predicted enzyme related to lactoylglutathione lyase
MSESAAHAGHFVWQDLMTSDAARAEVFYIAMFGWRIDATLPGYRLVDAGGSRIGGIVQGDPQLPAHWLGYVAVDDVEARVQLATKLGAQTAVPPSDMHDAGRFAVLLHPQAGAIALYHGDAKALGAEPVTRAPGRVCWNELRTNDDAAAVRFCAELFGWTSEDVEVGRPTPYRVQSIGGERVCGIVKARQPIDAPHWGPYFLVGDVAADTARAEGLGAKVVQEVAEIAGVGRFSHLNDPTGARFGLFQPA